MLQVDARFAQNPESGAQFAQRPSLRPSSDIIANCHFEILDLVSDFECHFEISDFVWDFESFSSPLLTSDTTLIQINTPFNLKPQAIDFFLSFITTSQPVLLFFFAFKCNTNPIEHVNFKFPPSPPCRPSVQMCRTRKTFESSPFPCTFTYFAYFFFS